MGPNSRPGAGSKRWLLLTMGIVVGFAGGFLLASIDEVRRFASSANWASLPTAVVGGLSGAVAAAVFSIVSAPHVARARVIGELRTAAEIAEGTRVISGEIQGLLDVVESGAPAAQLAVAIEAYMKGLERSTDGVLGVPLGSPGIVQGLSGIVALHRWRPLDALVEAGDVNFQGALLGAMCALGRRLQQALEELAAQPSDHLSATTEQELKTAWLFMWEMQAQVIFAETSEDD